MFLEEIKKTKTFCVYILVNVLEAMGANIVNTILEGLQGTFAVLFDAQPLMSIVSNLSPERAVKAFFKVPVSALGPNGHQIAKNIVLATTITKYNLFRATTHNKGILNGIIGVANALG